MNNEVAHHHGGVARFSDINVCMRIIGDVNLIKYAPGFSGDGRAVWRGAAQQGQSRGSGRRGGGEEEAGGGRSRWWVTKGSSGRRHISHSSEARTDETGAAQRRPDDETRRCCSLIFPTHPMQPICALLGSWLLQKMKLARSESSTTRRRGLVLAVSLGKTLQGQHLWISYAELRKHVRAR